VGAKPHFISQFCAVELGINQLS